MRNFIIYGVVCFIAVFNFVVSACCEERIIEEKIIYEDPTTAEPEKWVWGVSIDAWSFQDIDFTKENKKSKTTGEYYGVGFWVGKGTSSWFLNVNGGTMDIDRDFSKTERDRINSAFKYRGLLPKYDFKFFGLTGVPYYLAGLEFEKEDNTKTAKNVELRGKYNDQIVYWTSYESTDYNFEAFIGIGVVMPFSDWAGFRTDLSLVYSYLDRDIDFKNTVRSDTTELNYDGNGYGTNWTSTFYFNLFKGVSLQAGWQYEWRNYAYFSGHNAGANWGFFGMLGYTFGR